MEKEPLLVHLLFHPESVSARELARYIHRQLNGDLMVPGLRVPTVFCSTRDDGAPRARLRFNFAERNFVVVLADDDSKRSSGHEGASLPQPVPRMRQ